MQVNNPEYLRHVTTEDVSNDLDQKTTAATGGVEKAVISSADTLLCAGVVLTDWGDVRKTCSICFKYVPFEICLIIRILGRLPVCHSLV